MIEVFALAVTVVFLAWYFRAVAQTTRAHMAPVVWREVECHMPGCHRQPDHAGRHDD